jgi:paraquat-inducible protein B
MSQKANPTVVGVFVLVGLGLGLGGLLLFSSFSWFHQPLRFILYFESSVKGLNEGAAVAIAGVRVGQVSRVMLRYNQSEADTHLPVIIEVDGRVLRRLSEPPLQLDNPGALKRLVERGLRGRLQAESLVTGVLFVELAIQPNAPPPVYHQVQARYLEIPTAPNEIQMLLENLAKLDFQRVFSRLDAVLVVLNQRLGEFNAAEISAGLTNVLARLNAVVASPDLLGSLASARRALDEVQALSAKLSGQVDPLAAHAQGALEATTLALADVRRTSESLRGVLAPQSRLSSELTESLAELRQTARAIADLADYLNRNPNALLSGRERSGSRR